MTLDLNGSVNKDHHPCSGPLQEQQSKSSKLASISQSSKQHTNSSSSMGQTGIPHHNQQQQPTGGTTPGSPLAPGTGIPKPTAAVKGTAKATSTNMNQHLSSTKDYPSKTPTKQPNSNGTPAKNKISEGTKDLKSSHQKHGSRSEDGQGSRVTVALVNPMPARETNPSLSANVNSNSPSQGSMQNPNVNGNQVSASESVSTLSEISQNSGHSNSSGSSVIYKPTSSEDDLDLKISNRNVSSYTFPAWVSYTLNRIIQFNNNKLLELSL